MTVVNDDRLRSGNTGSPAVSEGANGGFRLALCIALAVGAAAGIAAAAATSWSRPLWADEVTTVQIAGAGSWSHLFEGVRMGLDATPPLYTGIGWLALHLGLPIERLPAALRTLNAIVLAASIVSLYRIARRFLDRCHAVAALTLFALLDSDLIAALCLEVRTYALYFALAVATAHTCLRLLHRPTVAAGLSHMACLALLAFTHTIGIAFAACLSGSLIFTHLLWKDYRSVSRDIAFALPAVSAFLLWCPVLRSQAQLGSWIERPTLHDLFKASFIYPGSALIVLAAGLILVLSQAFRHTNGAGGLRPTPSTHRCSIDRSRVFCLLLIPSFAAVTLTIWIESRLLFPVFVARYFTPNLLLLFLITTALIWSATIILEGHDTGLVIGSLAAAGFVTSLFTWKPVVENRIPCYDPLRNAFFEDEARAGLPVVSPYFHAWLTRLDRKGEVSLYPSDSSLQPDKSDAGRSFAHAFAISYMKRFASWSPSLLFTTSDQLSGMASGFVVIDNDDKGGWLKHAKSDPRFNFTLLKSEVISNEACRLWRVSPIRPSDSQN